MMLVVVIVTAMCCALSAPAELRIIGSMSDRPTWTAIAPGVFRAVYNSAYTVPTNGATYYCAFTEQTNAAGVYTGMGTNGLFASRGSPRWVDADRGVYFNGLDAALSIKYGTYHLNGATAATIAFWVYPLSLTGTRNFIGQSAVNYRHQDGVEVLPPSYYPYRYIQTPGLVSSNNAAPRLYCERWYHLALVYDGSTSNLTEYVDGVALSISNTTGAAWTLQQGDTEFGYRSASSATWFHGLMDDIGIWNRAFSQSEISALVAGTQHATPAWTTNSTAALCYHFTEAITNAFGQIVNTGTQRVHGTRMNYSGAYPTYGTNYAVFANTPISTQYAPIIPSNETWRVSFRCMKTNAQNNLYVWGAGIAVGGNTVRARSYYASDTMTWTLSADGSSTIVATAVPVAQSNGLWYVYDMVVNAPNRTIYLYTNGVQCTAVSNTTIGNFTFTNAYLQIGGYPSVSGWAGFLDYWKLERNSNTNQPALDYAAGGTL